MTEGASLLLMRQITRLHQLDIEHVAAVSKPGVKVMIAPHGYRFRDDVTAEAGAINVIERV